MFSRIAFATLFVCLLASACGPQPSMDAATVPPATATLERVPTPSPLASPIPSTHQSVLSDTLVIDGSSTVFPITEAVVRAYRAEAPQVRVQVGVSGTGGGFKTFCAGASQIAAASRPIKQSEMSECAAAGVAFIELPIAYDGISVLTHASNSWASCLTVDELRRLWEPAAEGKVMRWSDIRADWPDLPVTLYGAGADSGTYDYFTNAIVGAEGQSRGDYTGSEDDYLLGQDLADDPQGLGFFGYSYYREYQQALNLVAIDSGAGCVLPSEQTILDGNYTPLARPLFLYVRDDAIARPALQQFVTFYLTQAPQLVVEARCIPLTARLYELALQRFERRIVGTAFAGGSQVGVSLEALLTLEEQ